MFTEIGLRKELPMRRTILTTVVTVAASICMVIPATASTRVGPGPNFIKALNANVCVSVSPDEPNTTVLQGDYAAGNCRKMFFVLEGHHNGFQLGEWETRSGNSMASPNCTFQNGGTVSLAPPHSAGTVWVIFVQGGGAPIQIVNRRCDNGDCLQVLAASGSIGQAWHVVNKRVQTGYFTNMNIIQTSRAALQAVRHSIGRLGRHIGKLMHRSHSRVQAGC